MKKITFLIVMLMVVVTAKAQLVVTTLPLSTSMTISYIDMFRTPLLNTNVTPIVTTSSVIASPYVLYHISDVITLTPPINITINNITVNTPVKDNNINLVQFSTDLNTILFK